MSTSAVLMFNHVCDCALRVLFLAGGLFCMSDLISTRDGEMTAYYYA